MPISICYCVGFFICSYQVKCHLYRSYCANMHFWLNKQIQICYNNSLRRLSIPKHGSASEMCVNLNILAFGELMRKCVLGFCFRLDNCKVNNIIRSIARSYVIYNYLAPHRGRARYCNAHVCLCVCVCVCVFVCLFVRVFAKYNISAISQPIIMKLGIHITYGYTVTDKYFQNFRSKV